MHSLGVAGGGEVLGVSGKEQRGDAHAALEATSELVQPRSVCHAEHTDYSALLTRRRDASPARRERQGCQGRVVRRDHYLGTLSTHTIHQQK